MLALRPLSDILLRDDDLPRPSWSGEAGSGDRSPKNARGDHCLSTRGESDRAVRLWDKSDGEVFKRGNIGRGGACLGDINLSAGFIVLMSPLAIELIEALL